MSTFFTPPPPLRSTPPTNPPTNFVFVEVEEGEDGVARGEEEKRVVEEDFELKKVEEGN